MADDMKIIKQIGKQLGIELKPRPLEEIYIEKNSFAVDKTGQVKGLNLYDNKITDLTPLSALTNLTKLGLSDNQINQITDLTPLSALTNLTGLVLSDNQITDLTPLSALTNLTALYLNKNQITDLTPLNQITDLTPLSALTNLTGLVLSDNQITDLTPLSALTNLTRLDLDGNQITDLTPLSKLKHFERLDVSNNRIEKLPPHITSWWPDMEITWKDGLEWGALNLYGNPLTDPPEEVVKKGKDVIKNYFDEIERASVLFLESKLLLVGSGDVGKTTLMKKLKNQRFKVVPGKEDTTRK
jgi:Leucine-rich repeat (LRR) protein